MTTVASPRASIMVITYQHGAMIAECIESLLAQQTTFPFEIVIGEDGSDDGTKEICRDYANRYPDIIRLYERDQTKKVYLFGRASGKHNLLQSMLDCRGEFVAFCEGDDYWIDPYKLQRQVDWLDANPTYAFCSTNRAVWQDGVVTPDAGLEEAFAKAGGAPLEINQQNFFKPNLVKANVICYRRNWLDYDLLRTKYQEVKDTFIFFMLLRRGPGMILPDVTAVYRFHPGGRWSTLSNFNRLRLSYFCVRGMVTSYLGEAESLQKYYASTVRNYFVAAIKSRQWKDVAKVLIQNPATCATAALASTTRRFQ